MRPVGWAAQPHLRWVFREGGPRVSVLLSVLSKWIVPVCFELKGMLLNMQQVFKSEFDAVVGQEITD